MPTNGHEGHDAGGPVDKKHNPIRGRDAEQPGYEVEDVNVGGIVTFLTGLSGFLIIFFLFCFVMGKAINTGILKEDGPADKWHGGQPMHESDVSRKREDLTSNVTLEQREYAGMTQSFPTPRLQTDDGNQDTADMHAREDLLLDNYSTGSGLPTGAVRIPIDTAMALIAQRGLPKPAGGIQAVGTEMAGDGHLTATQPLTDGFARTGYELDQITARAQRMEFNQAEAKH
ncbi:MAG: hypothetical protein ACRYFU_07465 [Janthinobacterium lividum]